MRVYSSCLLPPLTHTLRHHCTATSSPRYPQLHSDISAPLQPQPSPPVATGGILFSATPHYQIWRTPIGAPAPRRAPDTLLTVASGLPRGDLREAPHIPCTSPSRSTKGSAGGGRGERRGRFVMPFRHLRLPVSRALRARDSRLTVASGLP